MTQNVDDLHERAGSSRVIHLHGQINKVRSSKNPELIYDIGGDPVYVGDCCEDGAQLRPHIVWFGEMVMDFDKALDAISEADKVMVVGTSLAVYPAASLVDHATHAREKVLVTREVDNVPSAYQWLRGNASSEVPKIVEHWLK